MKRWLRRMQKNHKGFTLIELICTIAIFSIVVTGVGSAMVISARNYQHGNAELDLQQQAQITANLLTNLIIDSNPDSIVVESEGTVLKVTKESTIYTISQSGNRLIYSIDPDPDPNPEGNVLAEHVATTDGFKVINVSGGNVDFRLAFETGDNRFASDYHVTPRNGMSDGGTEMSGAVSLYVENRLILEPGQTYDLNVNVSGTAEQGFMLGDTITGITALAGTEDEKTKINAVESSRCVRLEIGLNERGPIHFEVVSRADPSVKMPVDVLIRRVENISVNGFMTGGAVNMAGAKYKVIGPISGTNLDKENGAWYDVDYKDPYKVGWKIEYSNAEDPSSIWSDYFDINYGMDGKIPYAIVTSKRDMTPSCRLRIICTALHPEGKHPVGMAPFLEEGFSTNKTDKKYSTVSGYWELKYHGWGRMGTINMGLDPEEIGTAVKTVLEWQPIGGGVSAEVPVSQFDYENYDIRIHTEVRSAVGTQWGVEGMNKDYSYFDISAGNNGFLTPAERQWNDMRFDYTNWEFMLNPHDIAHAGGEDQFMAYSSPYFELPTGHTVASSPEAATNPIDKGIILGGWSHPYNTNNYGTWKDGANIIVIRELIDKTKAEGDPDRIVTRKEMTMPIEDVAIMYKNTSGAGDTWKRNNHVFVTQFDTIEDYKVYFYFDQGWDIDNTEFYFDNLDRFVGVIFDDPNDLNELRYDLPVTQSDKSDSIHWLNFKLNATTKQNAYISAQSCGGVIKEIYEYNPYLGYLWYTAEGVPSYPSTPYAGGPQIAKSDLDRVDGCDGTIIFHFVDPNVFGFLNDDPARPKVMYCPKQSEIDNNTLYYIDDATRYCIVSDSRAYYQLWNGAAWENTYIFDWGNMVTETGTVTGWIKIN